jgi:CheY-like chemotaxis protein
MTAATEHKDYAILITDDDTDSRAALRDIVEPAGFQTLLASSGEEAVDIVRGAPVHCRPSW